MLGGIADALASDVDLAFLLSLLFALLFDLERNALLQRAIRITCPSASCISHLTSPIADPPDPPSSLYPLKHLEYLYFNFYINLLLVKVLYYLMFIIFFKKEISISRELRVESRELVE